MTPTRFRELIELLSSAKVEFIVVGGVAAGALGFGLNFPLETSLGLVDLLGEITGGGSYEKLLPHTIRLDVIGFSCLCLDLETLIHVKRAAGRTKDFEAIAELEMIREEQEKQQQ